MKCTRLTFKSPLNGSVYCEGLVNEDDYRVDFGPYGVLELYNRGPDVLMFMTDRYEDLKDCVPEGLKEVVVKADFGESLELDGGLYLLTHIYVNKEPTREQYSDIVEWVTGQLSDGWGESLESHAVLTEEVEFNNTIFDEDTAEFTEEEQYYTAYYYLHPWQYGPHWYLEEMLRDTVELVIEEGPTERERVIDEINEHLSLITKRLEELK